MKYSIDRIENDIAILENIENNQIEEVLLKDLPKEIKEGSILKRIDNSYYLDNEEKEKKTQSIKEKMERLKNLANH